MKIEVIKNNLINISNSQIDLIFSIYGLHKDKITSRVLPLLTILKGLNIKERNEDYITYRDKSIASQDAVEDLIDTLEAGIEAYKIKYKVRVFPSDMKVMVLYEALNRLSPADIIKEVISSPKEAKKTIPTKKKKPIQKGRIEYNGDIKSQMVIDALKNI